jgi:pimeloyl-ACP methyl ester carboxylesterase
MLKIPVLAFWGVNDSYLPVTESVAIFHAAMGKAGNKQYTVRIFPNGRHDLVEGDTGSPSTGARLKKFPQGFWRSITDWVTKSSTANK